MGEYMTFLADCAIALAFSGSTISPLGAPHLRHPLACLRSVTLEKIGDGT
jgi:hypothetical protein